MLVAPAKSYDALIMGGWVSEQEIICDMIMDCLTCSGMGISRFTVYNRKLNHKIENRLVV